MTADELLRALGDLGDHGPELHDGGLASAPPELLDQTAAWARLRALSGARGWLTTTGTVQRVDEDRPLGDEPRDRLLQADVYLPERDETVVVRPAGERYAVRTVRRTEGPGYVVTRVYEAADGGRRLRFQTAWGPCPERTPGDHGWGPRLTRFAGFEER